MIPSVPRTGRLAAGLAVVLAALAVRAAWRDVRSEGAPRTAPAAERLASLAAAVPDERRIGFAKLEGDPDATARARLDLRLAILPRLLLDVGEPAPATIPATVLTWCDDATRLSTRAAARGYRVVRSLPDGYAILERERR